MFITTQTTNEHLDGQYNQKREGGNNDSRWLFTHTRHETVHYYIIQKWGFLPFFWEK